jgi:hypothetical protein
LPMLSFRIIIKPPIPTWQPWPVSL